MISGHTDREIQEQVLQELRWDTRVCESAIGVGVHNGIVTLSGTADQYAQKLAAQEAAHRVQGVLDVANDLAVEISGPHRRTDTEIAEAVRHTLEWDAFVPRGCVRSTVSNGLVLLDGEVDAWRQRQDAERAVRHLAGVTGVINDVVVRPPLVEPQRIKRTIEEALARRAEREAEQITVDVNGDTVTLTGAVRSWSAKRAVLGAVEHAPGVRAVEDRIIYYHAR